VFLLLCGNCVGAVATVMPEAPSLCTGTVPPYARPPLARFLCCVQALRVISVFRCTVWSGSLRLLMAMGCVRRHPAGCVGGTCMVQFLALPAQASVSVVFEGDTKGQGFLWLQKL
jgi:hypothetical protein